MTQKELIERIAELSGESKKSTKAVIDALEEIVIGAVTAGDAVNLPGFLKIERKLQKGKEGKIPGTDRTYKTEDRFVPKITPLKSFKDAVAHGA